MIDTTKEYIACSAIHYDNHEHYPFMSVYGIKSGFVLCGFRHPFICSVLPTNSCHEDIEKFNKYLNIDWEKNVIGEDGKPIRNYSITEGFMTSLGRFVDRKEGAKIALECGQIEKLSYSIDMLYSEDIFPLQANYASV